MSDASHQPCSLCRQNGGMEGSGIQTPSLLSPPPHRLSLLSCSLETPSWLQTTQLGSHTIIPSLFLCPGSLALAVLPIIFLLSCPSCHLTDLIGSSRPWTHSTHTCGSTSQKPCSGCPHPLHQAQPHRPPLGSRSQPHSSAPGLHNDQHISKYEAGTQPTTANLHCSILPSLGHAALPETQPTLSGLFVLCMPFLPPGRPITLQCPANMFSSSRILPARMHSPSRCAEFGLFVLAASKSTSNGVICTNG